VSDRRLLPNSLATSTRASSVSLRVEHARRSWRFTTSEPLRRAGWNAGGVLFPWQNAYSRMPHSRDDRASDTPVAIPDSHVRAGRICVGDRRDRCHRLRVNACGFHDPRCLPSFGGPMRSPPGLVSQAGGAIRPLVDPATLPPRPDVSDASLHDRLPRGPHPLSRKVAPEETATLPQCPQRVATLCRLRARSPATPAHRSTRGRVVGVRFMRPERRRTNSATIPARFRAVPRSHSCGISADARAHPDERSILVREIRGVSPGSRCRTSSVSRRGDDEPPSFIVGSPSAALPPREPELHDPHREAWDERLWVRRLERRTVERVDGSPPRAPPRRPRHRFVRAVGLESSPRPRGPA